MLQHHGQEHVAPKQKWHKGGDSSPPPLYDDIGKRTWHQWENECWNETYILTMMHLFSHNSDFWGHFSAATTTESPNAADEDAEIQFRVRCEGVS